MKETYKIWDLFLLFSKFLDIYTGHVPSVENAAI